MTEHLVHGEYEGQVQGAISRLRTGFVDVHCHCLPNLDDGPRSTGEAVALCRMLVSDNVTTVVATPHQLGRFEGHTSADAIRETTELLNRRLAEEEIDLTVLPGAEVRLDERIAQMLRRHEILTLADAHRHLLLELPWEVLIDIEPLLIQFFSAGLDVIIAHPERNVALLRHPDVLRRWLGCGASLQITGGSLLGDYGRQAQQAAWGLLAEGCVSLVATDAHDNHVGACMTRAFEMIRAGFGDDLATLLCVDNPTRVVAGESLVSATALDRGEAW